MSKKLSITVKTAIAFILFCAVFISVVGIMVSHGRRSEENLQKTPPKTEASPYENMPTVIIDAGHGGEDGGAVGVDGIFEKNINLAIALELEEMLRATGIKTRLTRDTDTLLYDRNSDYQGHKKAQDAAARLAIAEEYENAVFISIHMNSFPQAKYKGLQVYYSPNSPSSALLAKKIQDTVITNLQPDNTRQIKQSDKNIYLLDKISHPAILIECGFLSNPEECEKLSDKDYQRQLSFSIFCGMMEYMERKK